MMSPNHTTPDDRPSNNNFRYYLFLTVLFHAKTPILFYNLFDQSYYKLLLIYNLGNSVFIYLFC